MLNLKLFRMPLHVYIAKNDVENDAKNDVAFKVVIGVILNVGFFNRVAFYVKYIILILFLLSFFGIKNYLRQKRCQRRLIDGSD